MLEFLREDENLKGKIEIPADVSQQKDLLRALMNVRLPRELPQEFLKIQDEYFKEALKERGVTKLSSLHPVEKQIYLWRGDITTLACGAIVNAANEQMLGCFIPNHRCIDNAIHTFAGMELRLEMARIMKTLGRSAKTGEVIITAAYNLPCEYIIHVTGPIVYGKLTELEERQLKECYENCLRLADHYQISSIAFCCISTGEFHFPNERAAQIAVETVRSYIKTTGTEMEVIFNVFKQEDEAIYRKLLGPD